MNPDTPNAVGLCARCVHMRVVTTPRSRFVLCEKSREDERFARYPRLPVLTCAGHQPVGTPSTERDPEPGAGPGEK